MINSSSSSSLLPMDVQFGMSFSVYLGKDNVRYVHDRGGKFRGEITDFTQLLNLMNIVNM